MTAQEQSLVYGPVPSRRLGRSLGVNNIPSKVCTFSCVYCQVGRTRKISIERQPFYPTEQITEAVREKLRQAKDSGQQVDYVSFVPDGEPTLDANLGSSIKQVRELGPRVALISNASLISREDVREDLSRASWVSLKVDSVLPQVWRKIDRPHPKLNLEEILEGILAFRQSYSGQLVTETLLVEGYNDSEESLRATADFLSRVNPSTAYVSSPIRPPAEKHVHPAGETTLQAAYQIYKERLESVELLVAYEGNEFATGNDAARDLLGITAVHPMREDAALLFLDRAGADRSLLKELVSQGLLARVRYGDEWFYLRRFSSS
jgi:wyosine [tRNA(Phe)-imidazoG37] synthetase (radical SAM superfamily)